MKNDSKINKQQEAKKGLKIKGTFLDKDVKQESLAEALIKGFDEAEKAIQEQREIINSIFIKIGKSEFMRSSQEKLSYFLKYRASNWLIRWYWKRKYNKACKEYEFWVKYNSQLNIKPIKH